MQLNLAQRSIVLVSIVIIALMGIAPPWVYTYSRENTYSEEPAGYGLIVSPPPRKAEYATHGIRIDTSRLLIQWVVVLAIGAVGILVTTTLNGKRAAQKPTEQSASTPTDQSNG